MKGNIPLMVFEVIGVIVVLSFVFAVMGLNSGSTGGFSFQVKQFGGAIQGSSDPYSRVFAGKAVEASLTFSCKDLVKNLEKKVSDLKYQVKAYAFVEELKEDLEKAEMIKNTYGEYSVGIPGYQWRQRQTMQCVSFSELVFIVGLDKAIPKDNVAFCCKR